MSLTSLFRTTATLLASVLALHTSTAQLQLNFKRIVNNWPTIELYFSVACNGQRAYLYDKTKFRVVENGIKVGEFELWSPAAPGDCGISVVMVFDVSGSMAGAGMAGAKAAGNAFIDELNGVIDEAAIIAFNEVAWVVQSMTTIKPHLYNAINGLSTGGYTAVWDGIYTGLTELIANGVNTNRAVIAVTDGTNSAGSRTPADIISIANRNRIRVFTIGLGTAVDEAELKEIANTTGGQYYQTQNPSQLTQIYKEISTIIFQGYQEYLITYTAMCMDGSLRTVDLSLLNFCGGSDMNTKSYISPIDSSLQLPSMPVINRTGDVLSTIIASGYQWFLDGVPLQGETNQFLIVKKSGNYTVTIMDANGCKATSLPFSVLTGIDSPKSLANDIALYPDPTTGRIQVHLPETQEYPASLSIHNILGSTIVTKDVSNRSERIQEFNIKGYPYGIYICRVVNRVGSQMKIFLKAR